MCRLKVQVPNSGRIMTKDPQTCQNPQRQDKNPKQLEPFPDIVSSSLDELLLQNEKG